LSPAVQRRFALTIGVAVWAQAASARAQDQRAPVAAAEALFQEGRALLMAGDPAHACPKLAESHRLDPATGTLLALALCQEQQGKLASAWAAFVEVEGRSRRDGRADRERTAREHGAALRPRLSTLTLQLAPRAAEVSGLVISVDGVAIGRGAWSVAIPVDGGLHLVEATAPGRQVWRTTASVEAEGDHLRVEVPVLASMPDLTAAGAGSVPSRPPLIDPPPREGESAGHPPPRMALVLGGAGVLALVLGAGLAFDAKRDYDDALAGCDGDVCLPDPFRRAQAARRKGNWATVSVIGGGLLIASGALLWLWAPGVDGPVASGSRPAGGRVALGLGSDGALWLGGRF
jgi:hypothetical protein